MKCCRKIYEKGKALYIEKKNQNTTPTKTKPTFLHSLNNQRHTKLLLKEEEDGRSDISKDIIVVSVVSAK